MDRRLVASMKLFIVLLAVVWCVADLPAKEAPVRTPNQNHLVQGAYSFVLHGTYAGEPYAASGVLTFDGAGKITGGSATFVLNSGVATADLLADPQSTYVVQSDGTGTLRVFFASSAGFGLKCALAVSDHGRLIYLNTTGLRSPITFEDTSGPTATGEASQQQ
jgi:hypothetical protein